MTPKGLISKAFRPLFYDSFIQTRSLFENTRYRYFRSMERYYEGLLESPVSDVTALLRPSPFSESGSHALGAQFMGCDDYGLGYQLVKYAEIFEFFLPKVSWFYDGLVLSHSSKMFDSLVCGNSSERESARRQFPEASLLALGPLVGYAANPARGASQPLKSRWGRIVSYFPDREVNESEEKYLEVGRLAKTRGADTVLVFIGTAPGDLARVKTCQKFGFVPVTAGTIRDLYFLNRLRLILESSEVVVSDSGTPFAAASSLGISWMRLGAAPANQEASPEVQTSPAVSSQEMRDFLCSAEIRHHKKYGQTLRGL